ncbi:unnamed protein product [Adineta steineri]|uniref:Uncharacterized protein n=1 Tax=Adineta steineri TaxID=433720 RepID=A0A815PGP0_9BILA|nr:unnamed protein product [Adineta steineri]CAF1454966.1 unnamed protein product [Adineta steineri]
MISSTSSPLTPLFRENVMHLVYLFFGFSLLMLVCGFLERICWTTATKRQTSRMSVLLFQSLIQRNMTYFDTNQTTQYNSKLFTNIEKIKNGIGFEFVMVIALITGMIFSIIICFILNWKLSLIMSCIIPIVVGISLMFAKFVAKETQEQLSTYSKAGQIAQEVFSSLRTVLSFNGSKLEQKQYDKELQINEWCTVRKDAAYGVLFAQGAAVSVFRLIDEVHDENLNEKEILEENISDENSISDINGDIEFDNVSFSYPSRENATALNNLKLTARANQTTALVGSSGCGKSTCVSLLLRYYEPSSGRIMIGGQSLTDYKIKPFRQHIGVVSQEPILFGISIYENIRFGKLNATREEIENAAEQANAHKFIMKLPNKYETLVGERGIQLSGGEKQRIALARALVKQPSILLLDEATSALDNVSERVVQEALDRACKNRTTIVIAHRLTTIKNADYIYVLDEGSVIEEGTHETLLAKDGGRYQTMVKMQQSENTFHRQESLMQMEKAAAEDEEQLLARVRLLSESEAIDINRYVAFGIAGAKLVSRLRSKAFACLLRQEVAYFDRPENSSGAICTQLSSNAAAIQDMAGARLGFICETLSLCFFGFVLGIFYSLELTIIIAIPFFIILIAAIMQIRLSSWLKTQSDLIYSEASTLAVEVITNMRTVKQLSMENEVLRQYSDMIDQVLGMSWKPDAVFATVSALYWAMDSFALGLLYWRALVLVENNELDMNDVVMISAFGMFAIEALKVVGMLGERIGSSFAAAHAFFDLFDRIPTIDNGSTKGQELTDFRGETEFNQVKFIYPSRPTVLVLNKLQLSIKSGQRIALVGASGCGKSTIVQLLERFYDVTNGQLAVDGVDIRKLNIQWLRSCLGVVSQEPVLFDLTIAENISYGLENIPMDEIVLAATKANIHEFIQQLPQGYDTKVGVKGSFLSGGEKQRIAIARVLIRRPKILLLDEATSAMDPYNERIVQETLDQAQTDDSSRTSIIIAHRLSTIRSCDLIYVLEMGRIVESGTHIELIQKGGIYYKMLNAQNNVQ